MTLCLMLLVSPFCGLHSLYLSYLFVSCLMCPTTSVILTCTTLVPGFLGQLTWLEMKYLCIALAWIETNFPSP